MAVLLPCRTAMRGAFPLAGTYFQTNEVFVDSNTLQHPVLVTFAYRTHLQNSSCVLATLSAAKEELQFARHSIGSN